MTTQEVATELVELCRKGEFEKAQKELYAQDALSVEPVESPGYNKEEKGLDKIIEKGHHFMSSLSEVHSVTVSDPLVTGNIFACTLEMDITMKEGGRTTMAELCVYEVKDGKIAAERFFM